MHIAHVVKLVSRRTATQKHEHKRKLKAKGYMHLFCDCDGPLTLQNPLPISSQPASKSKNYGGRKLADKAHLSGTHCHNSAPWHTHLQNKSTTMKQTNTTHSIESQRHRRKRHDHWYNAGNTMQKIPLHGHGAAHDSEYLRLSREAQPAKDCMDAHAPMEAISLPATN